jgi:hypothetical protein
LTEPVESIKIRNSDEVGKLLYSLALSQRWVSCMVFEKQIVLKVVGFVKTDAVGDEVRDKVRISRLLFVRIYLKP